MKIIPFPSDEPELDPPEIAALEAALSGDIRALAPAIDREFEASLRQRLSGTSAPAPAPARPRRAWRWWKSRPLLPRLISLGGAGALAALVIAIAIIGPLSGNSSHTTLVPLAGATRSGSASPRLDAGEAPSASTQASPAKGEKADSEESKAQTPGAASPAATSSPATGASNGRVQQLGASLTLAGSPEEVQQLADGVSRVVIAEGGFVASSQVQVERGASNSATLVLSVPAGRLSRTLTALGRLGSVRAETQSLQDITNAYDSDRGALGDALAERSALLRALAQATTQGQIESLHRRLAIAGGAIERARNVFAQISSQAANANLEVEVLGEAHRAGGDLTLGRGLHDAGRVLTVALAIALIGLAALIPLLAVGIALALGGRALRRGARERVLDGS